MFYVLYVIHYILRNIYYILYIIYFITYREQKALRLCVFSSSARGWTPPPECGAPKGGPPPGAVPPPPECRARKEGPPPGRGRRALLPEPYTPSGM